jgi:hypothetical protein
LHACIATLRPDALDEMWISGAFRHCSARMHDGAHP